MNFNRGKGEGEVKQQKVIMNVYFVMLFLSVSFKLYF